MDSSQHLLEINNIIDLRPRDRHRAVRWTFVSWAAGQTISHLNVYLRRIRPADRQTRAIMP